MVNENVFGNTEGENNQVALSKERLDSERERELTEEEIRAKNEMIDCLKEGNIDKALEIKDEFNLSEEVVQEAAKEEIIVCLRLGSVDEFLEIKDKFNISEEVVQEAAKEGMINWIESESYNRVIKRWIGVEDYYKNVFKIKDKFNVSEEVVQSVAKKGMICWTKRRDYSKALEIKDKFNIPEEFLQSPEIQEAAKKGMIYCLAREELDKALEIKDEFNVSEEFLQSPEVQEAAKEGIIYFLKKGYLNLRISIKDKFNIPEEFLQSPEVQEAAKEGIIYCLAREELDKALEIKDEFNVSEDVGKIGLVEYLKMGNIDKALEMKDKFNIPEEILHSPEVQEVVRISKIFLNVDVESLEKEKKDIDDLEEEELMEMFDFARKELKDWKDEQVIAIPFKLGAETFGYKKMLKYIRRDGLSIHDAVHSFRDIIELFKASGLDESAFYNQILNQVKMDDREYEEGTAHDHLNTIAKTANRNIEEVTKRAKEYKDIEKLQELVANFDNPQRVFSSWAELKRYSQLEQLLGKTEILDKLKGLKEEGGSDKLYRYIETLAFHPDSKVDMGAVIEFWRDPKSFLERNASHTPEEIHDQKKPSNYMEMPNLGLTAEELRDALVEGKIDSLSVFKPIEIRYTIPIEKVEKEPLIDLVKKALGSRKEKIKGEARNPKKLFSELKRLFKENKLSFTDYIRGNPLPEDIDISSQIEDLLYHPDFGIKRAPVKTREFVVSISKKSDPESAIAGDDTASCMPFGDGKNTLYTFNLNTAQLLIRIVKGDGKERTIAQSVLTKDMDIRREVPEVIEALKKGGRHLEDILSEDILDNSSVYIACDNIEVSPNYSDQRYEEIIELLLRDFFREYINRYGESQRLDREKVVIGQGHTDALTHLPSEKNTYIPQAPVSYSDKTGENVYVLNLENEAEADLILEKSVKESGLEGRVESALLETEGLSYLTFEDTLKVGFIEGKAYSDNKSLMQFLSDLENGLIAKEISNSAKDRPNMSLKYTDERGKMRAYLLSWEGQITDDRIDVGRFFNQPCIYIVDIASDKKDNRAGIRLIKGFLELYKENYLNKGNYTPVYAQMREKTSYKIIGRQLDRIGEELGIEFELTELPTYQVGDDTMHPVIIQPIKK